MWGKELFSVFEIFLQYKESIFLRKQDKNYDLLKLVVTNNIIPNRPDQRYLHENYFKEIKTEMVSIKKLLILIKYGWLKNKKMQSV